MKLKKARKKFRKAIIKEALKLINNSKKTNYYIKIGWIDFVSDDLIQYEIVGVCKGMNNRVLLVHKDNSEGAKKGDIYFMHQIKSIDVLESILKAVKKHTEPLQELFENTIPKINDKIIANQIPEKFARKCDATGEGMNEGFCFRDGERYFKYKKDAKKYAKEIGYSSLQEAYVSDAYYHTSWNEILEEEDEWYDADGKMYTNCNKCKEITIVSDDFYFCTNCLTHL